MRDLVARIEAAGGRVGRSKRSLHIKVYLGAQLIGIIPSSPSDHRAIKNCVSDLRRRGLAL